MAALAAALAAPTGALLPVPGNQIVAGVACTVVRVVSPGGRTQLPAGERNGRGGRMTGVVQHHLSLPAWIALLVVFALPTLESSAFVGFLCPGEAAVLLGGVVASHGHLPVSAVIVAAIAGQSAT